MLSRLLRKISVFDVAAGHLIGRLEDLAGGAASVAFDAGGNVVCGPADGPAYAATIWDYRRGARRSLPGPDGSATDSSGNKLLEFAVDRQSNRLLGVYQLPSGSAERVALALYDLNTGQLLKVGGPAAMHVSLAPGGQRAAFRGRSGILQIFDLEKGAAVASIAAHAGGVDATAWSSDGLLVATGGQARAMLRDPESIIPKVVADPFTLKLWEAKTGTLRGKAELPEHVSMLAFSPKGPTLAASDAFGTVHLLSASNPERAIARIPVETSQTVVARISPDGQRIGRLLTAASQLEISDAALFERR